jgi:hypothetical protein
MPEIDVGDKRRIRVIDDQHQRIHLPGCPTPARH